jgi:hypothetical protein
MHNCSAWESWTCKRIVIMHIFGWESEVGSPISRDRFVVIQI